MSRPDRFHARRLVLTAFRWVDGHADMAAVLRDAGVISAVGAALANPFQDRGVDVVVGIEARGFVLAALTARALGVGLVLVRKEGSHHPGPTIRVRTAPDWRGRRLVLRLHPHELAGAERVLLVDDWIETGSQATGVGELVTRAGAQMVGVATLIDDCNEEVRQRLDVRGLVRSNELPRSVQGSPSAMTPPPG